MLISEVEKRLQRGSPELSYPEVRSLAELAITMEHPVQKVPAPELVSAMSEADVRKVLMNCPESPHFMHGDLDM